MVVPQWFIDFSADPQLVKQYGQLPRDRHDRSLFGILPSALSETEPPAPQITVFSKGAQNVVSALHQQGSEVSVSFFADVQLWLTHTRVSASGTQPHKAPRIPASAKSVRVVQSQNVGQRDECPYSLHLFEQSDMRINFLGDLLDPPMRCLWMCERCYTRRAQQLLQVIREHEAPEVLTPGFVDTVRMARASLLAPAVMAVAEPKALPSNGPEYEGRFTQDQAAQAAGINPMTLRHWLSKGLFQPPKVKLSEYRWLWTQEDVERIKTARRKAGRRPKGTT